MVSGEDGTLALQRRAATPLWRYWAAAFAWLVIISVGSSDLLSAQRTSFFVLYALRLFHVDLRYADAAHILIRKLTHFVIYSVFSALLFRAWRATLPQRRRAVADGPRRWVEPLWNARWAALALAMAVATAALDEFHQSFVPARTAAAGDVLLDSLGALFAHLVLLVVLIGREREVSSF